MYIRFSNSSLDGIYSEASLSGITIPQDLLLEIFSHLNFNEIEMFGQINKAANALANSPAVLKNRIYHEQAFTPEDWGFYFGKSLKVNEAKVAFQSLPSNIGQIFKSPCPVFPKKLWWETHVIVWIPEGLTLNNFGELLKQKFPRNAKGYYRIFDEIVSRYGDMPVEKSGWITMTKFGVPGSLGKSFDHQKLLVKKLKSRDLESYEVPKTLEVIACFSAQFFKFKKNVIFDGFYARCKESIDDDIIQVCLNSNGYQVGTFKNYHESIGIAAIRKL